MNNKFLFTVLILFLSFNGFTQTCPCVRTKIIGNDTNATFVHNNRVKAMCDTSIVSGEMVLLKSTTCVGSPSWHIKGSGTKVNSLTLLPTETTEYVVKSTLFGCPDVYDTVKVTVLKKNNIRERFDDNIFLYPNPSTNELYIHSTIQLTKIEILDVNGRALFTIQDGNSLSYQPINISNLQQGTYFIILSAIDKNVYSKKIIKN